MGDKQYEHFNHPSNLPPVDCPLVINREGVATRVIRTSFIERRDRELVYITPSGEEIVGRFPWTYP